MKDIVWVDDDFMLYANIPFDYEAFEIIDSKVDYLNTIIWEHIYKMTIAVNLRSAKNLLFIVFLTAIEFVKVNVFGNNPVYRL